MRLNVLAVIPSEFVDSFIKDKKLENVDILTTLSLKMKKAISAYLERNCGVSVGIPLPTLSKFSGSNLSLDAVGKRVNAVLPVMRGTTIWRLEVKDDLVASVPYSILLEYNAMFEASEGEALEMLTEVFQDEITLGPIEEIDEDEDVISFIPCIGLDKCKHVIVVDAKWSETLAKVPGLQMSRIAVFDKEFS